MRTTIQTIFFLLIAGCLSATPIIKIVSPYATPDSGWVVRGAVSFTVNATSSLPITKVEFYIDDILKSTDATYPYSFFWNTRTYTVGDHQLKAIAYDSQGIASITQAVTVKPALTLKATKNTAVTAGLLPAMTSLLPDVSMRDVSICVGADNNYYMVGSISDNNLGCRNEGVNLWQSANLKDWNYVGLIWSFEGDAATTDKAWNNFYNIQFRAVWNTKIRYTEGNYYISFSNPIIGSRLLKSSTGKPEGPYTTATLESNLLQTQIFSDAINKTNLYYDLLHTGFSFSYGGRDYLATSNINDTTLRFSSYVGVADASGNYANWHEALPCGGNAGYFVDTQGDLWATFFGNDDAAPWRERAGIVKMSVDNTTGKLRVSSNQNTPPATSLNSITTPTMLKIFPNPAANFLIVDNATNALVTVYNFAGIEVIRLKSSDKILKIDLRYLKNGLYLLQSDSGGTQQTVKFTVFH